MEKINKKFAWIVDGSGANSWGVKNDEAIHLKDDTPFINSTFSFDSKNGGSFLFNWQYPFMFEEGYFLNWNDYLKENKELPDIDFDIIFLTVMKNYEECTVEKVRKKYPNAKIAGYIKELWQPGQHSFTFDYPGYLRHIEFLKECDAVVLYNMEMGVFRDMQEKVGTEFSIVTMPMDVDYFYKNFYKQERELSLFCYLPPIHNRRSNTEQFSRYISDKYNIKFVDRDVEAYRTQSQENPNEFRLRDFINKWSSCMFHINLDPDCNMPGSQAMQCAALGVINIGGLNCSHRLLWPETATNDPNILEGRIRDYLENPSKVHNGVDYAHRTVKKYHDTTSVIEQIKNIKWNR